MKRTSEILIRFLLSLSLILAAWPVGANEMACVPVSKSATSACAMPCCQGSHPAMAHCPDGPVVGLRGTTVSRPSCGCEISAGQPATSARTQTKNKVELAVPSSVRALRRISAPMSQSLAVPVDQRAPSDSMHALPPGRAPPVV